MLSNRLNDRQLARVVLLCFTIAVVVLVLLLNGCAQKRLDYDNINIAVAGYFGSSVRTTPTINYVTKAQIIDKCAGYEWCQGSQAFYIYKENTAYIYQSTKHDIKKVVAHEIAHLYTPGEVEARLAANYVTEK